MAMSSRTWLLYFYQNRFHLTPLSYESLEFAASFASEQCPEGVVAIAANTLRSVACFVKLLRYFPVSVQNSGLGEAWRGLQPDVACAEADSAKIRHPPGVGQCDSDRDRPQCLHG